MNASSFLARQTFNVCRSCRRDLRRRFTTSRAPRISFQPYPLSQPPPPGPSPPTKSHNAAGQDNAHPLGSPLPGLHETRPPLGARVDVSTVEGEVKKTEPALAELPEAEKELEPATASTQSPASIQAAPETTSAATTPASSKRPSRLRTPRKAAIKLTDKAVTHLRKLLETPTPQLVKVGVRNRGCSGLAYHLEYVDKPGPFDETIEQDGVKVLIDSKALFSIIGSEMDWVEDHLHEGFKFRNPNIKEQCGCGESFMV